MIKDPYMNKCVYVFLDHRKSGKYIYDEFEFEFEPIYVGKGNLNRPKAHKYRTENKTRFYTKYNKILKETGLHPKYIIVKDNLTEEDANLIEIYLIKKIGRIDIGGTLTNLSDGGEGQSGWKMSDETKHKKSIAMMGKHKGRILSDETKQKISKTKTGTKGIGLGRKMSDKAKYNMSLAKKGKFLGENNSNYGNKMSQKSKDIISEKNKGKLLGKKHPNYGNLNHKNVVAKDTWELIDIHGNIHIIESLNSFCKLNNINVSNMRDIWSGRRKSAYKNWVSVKKITNNVKNKRSD